MGRADVSNVISLQGFTLHCFCFHDATYDPDNNSTGSRLGYGLFSMLLVGINTALLIGFRDKFYFLQNSLIDRDWHSGFGYNLEVCSNETKA